MLSPFVAQLMHRSCRKSLLVDARVRSNTTQQQQHTTTTQQQHTTTTHNNNRLEQVCVAVFSRVTFSLSSAVGIMAERDSGGAARRRRKRRLRMHWRHEQVALQMTLAAALHHSRDFGLETYSAPRSQKTARAREAAGTEYYALDEDDDLLAAAEEPTCLVKPPLPALQVGRVVQPLSIVPMVLGAPALQTTEEVNTTLLAPLQFQEQVIVQEIPEVQAFSSIGKGSQPSHVVPFSTCQSCNRWMRGSARRAFCRADR